MKDLQCSYLKITHRHFVKLQNPLYETIKQLSRPEIPFGTTSENQLF